MNVKKLSHSVLALGIVVTATAVPGCGNGDPAADANAPPPVDARYATADAIVEQFNLFTTSQPVNMAAVYDLCYAENDLQRQLLKMGRWSIPIYDLDAAMRDRFQASIDSGDAFVARANQPARIATRDGDRATAEYIDWNGKRETLHLVKWNNRWWISGYTDENDRDVRKIPREHLTWVEMTVRAMGAVAPALAARVRGGEFTSAAAVRSAITAAMIEHVEQNRASFQEYESYIRDNARLLSQGLDHPFATPGGPH